MCPDKCTVLLLCLTADFSHTLSATSRRMHGDSGTSPRPLNGVSGALHRDRKGQCFKVEKLHRAALNVPRVSDCAAIHLPRDRSGKSATAIKLAH